MGAAQALLTLVFMLHRGASFALVGFSAIVLVACGGRVELSYDGGSSGGGSGSGGGTLVGGDCPSDFAEGSSCSYDGQSCSLNGGVDCTGNLIQRPCACQNHVWVCEDFNGPACITPEPSPDDAGLPAISPVALASPLCFENVADAGTCVCNPDDVELACGEVVPGAGAASEDAGESTPGVVDAGAAAEPAQACRVTGASQAWDAVGPGQDGAQCEKGRDCGEGLECVGYPGQCRRYCCSGNAACSSTGEPTFCDVQLTAAGNLPVPVCMPVEVCALLPTPAVGVAGSCPESETCEVVTDTGVTSCVPIGNAQAGDFCDGDYPDTNAIDSPDPFHCAAGLSCLGVVGDRHCVALCSLSATSSSDVACPTGTTCLATAQLLSPLVGLCL